MVQALEADPSMDVILGMGAHAPVGAVRAGRVRQGRPDLLHPLPDREGDPGRHDPAHVHDHRLDHGASAGPARDQRDRDDEPPGGGGSSRVAGPPRRGEVVHSRLRLGGQRPEHLPARTRHAPARPRHGVERSLVEAEGLVRTSPRTTPPPGHGSSLRQRPRDATSRTPISRNLSRPVCPSIFGYDPLLQFVEEDDVVRALDHVTRDSIPGLYNVAGDGQAPLERGGRHLRHPAPARCRRTARSKIRPVARLFDLPERARGPAALRTGRRHAPVRRDGIQLQRSRAPVRCAPSSGPCGCAGSRAGSPRRTPTSTTSSSSSATRRRSSAPPTPEAQPVDPLRHEVAARGRPTPRP